MRTRQDAEGQEDHRAVDRSPFQTSRDDAVDEGERREDGKRQVHPAAPASGTIAQVGGKNEEDLDEMEGEAIRESDL